VIEKTDVLGRVECRGHLLGRIQRQLAGGAIAATGAPGPTRER
jgi:hypothetical protein